MYHLEIFLRTFVRLKTISIKPRSPHKSVSESRRPPRLPARVADKYNLAFAYILLTTPSGTEPRSTRYPRPGACQGRRPATSHQHTTHTHALTLSSHTDGRLTLTSAVDLYAREGLWNLYTLVGRLGAVQLAPPALAISLSLLSSRLSLASRLPQFHLAHTPAHLRLTSSAQKTRQLPATALAPATSHPLAPLHSACGGGARARPCW